MSDAKLESEKDALIQAITEVYAHGGLDMAAFEGAVTRISACPDSRALATEVETLGLGMPLVLPAVADRRLASAPQREAIQLDCVSSSISKSGDWVASGSYCVRLKSSSARLDLREYEGAKGFRLVIEVEATSSVLSLTVPRGFQVEDRFSERVSSAVRNRPRGESYDDNRIVLTGNLRSSVVKVKYR
ncbi:MAG: hypothetical protein ACLQMF_06060 [Rectinemataceae bacterium]